MTDQLSPSEARSISKSSAKRWRVKIALITGLLLILTLGFSVVGFHVFKVAAPPRVIGERMVAGAETEARALHKEQARGHGAKASGLLLGRANPTGVDGDNSTVEVCGLGKVAKNEFGAPNITVDEAVMDARTADVASELMDSANPQERAAGIVIRAHALGRIAMSEAGKDASCASLPGGGCYEKSKPIGDAKTIETAAPLFEMAAKTSDPSIYNAVLQLCDQAYLVKPPSCSNISAALNRPHNRHARLIRWCSSAPGLAAGFSAAGQARWA